MMSGWSWTTKRRPEWRRRWKHNDRGQHSSTTLHRLHSWVQHDARMSLQAGKTSICSCAVKQVGQQDRKAGWCITTFFLSLCKHAQITAAHEHSTAGIVTVNLNHGRCITCRMRAVTRPFWVPWPHGASLSHPLCSGLPTHPPAAPSSVRCTAATWHALVTWRRTGWPCCRRAAQSAPQQYHHACLRHADITASHHWHAPPGYGAVQSKLQVALGFDRAHRTCAAVSAGSRRPRWSHEGADAQHSGRKSRHNGCDGPLCPELPCKWCALGSVVNFSVCIVLFADIHDVSTSEGRAG
jgi:hypothetical protein